MPWRVFFISVTLAVSSAFGTQEPSAVPEEASIVEHLNAQLDMDAQFAESDGKSVKLRDLFVPGRPAIIVPLYYGCPRLCGLVLKGLSQLLNELDLRLGKDFSVVTFSINPNEGPDLASKRADTFKKKLSDQSGRDGWHFLTTDAATITQITTQLGFGFREDKGEYIHASAAMILTPEGKISRYFYGISYPAPKIKYSLIEASAGNVGGAFDRVFLFCFRYDHTTGKYTPIIWNVIRIVCLGFAGLVFLSLMLLKLRERHA